MSRMILVTLTVAVALLASISPVLAGPNAGGSLICHDAHFTYTDGGTLSECLRGTALVDCGTADAELDSAYSYHSPRQFKVYAAFPPESNPRLMGIAWGIEYEAENLSLLSWGHCGDFEISDTDWPAPGSGSHVTWNWPQTAHIVPIYYFYAYLPHGTGSTALFRLIPHPTYGGLFGDDSVPAVLDSIAAYGALGFDMAGWTACPWIKSSGAAAPPERGPLFSVRPSVATSSVEISLVEPRQPQSPSTPRILEVVDAAGRLVRRLKLRSGGVRWDLRDLDGVPVASGVYWVRETAGTSGERLVVLR